MAGTARAECPGSLVHDVECFRGGFPEIMGRAYHGPLPGVAVPALPILFTMLNEKVFWRWCPVGFVAGPAHQLTSSAAKDLFSIRPLIRDLRCLSRGPVEWM